MKRGIVVDLSLTLALSCFCVSASLDTAVPSSAKHLECTLIQFYEIAILAFFKN